MTVRDGLKGVVCLAAVCCALACGDSSGGGSSDAGLRFGGVIASRNHESGVVRLRWVPVDVATGYIARIYCGDSGEVIDQILLSPSGCTQLLSDGFTAGLCESDVTTAPYQGRCSNARIGISTTSEIGESVSAYPLMAE